MPNDTLTNRSFNPLDEKKILTLFRTVFHAELAPEQWRWQFLKNPYSQSFIWVSETGDKEIIGHYSLVPVPFWNQDKIERAGAASISMVHPAYQKKGIFKSLGALAEKKISEENLKVSIALVNDKSFPIYTKYFKWVPLNSNLPIYFTISNPFLLFKKYLKYKRAAVAANVLLSPILNGLFKTNRKVGGNKFIKPTHKFDHRLDILWNKVKRNFSFSVNRDSEYLNWRLIENPKPYSQYVYEENSEILGFIAIRDDDKFGYHCGYIAEFFFDFNRPSIGNHLLRFAVDDLRQKGCIIITALALEPAQLRNTFKRGGFFILPKFLRPHGIHLCVKDCSGKKMAPSFYDPQKWFVSWTDHDVV